jgi:hypothetical protein
LWGNVEKCDRPRQDTCGNTIGFVHVACWITKGTDTHSEYVIIIYFPWQQCLRERSSVLRLYVNCMCCFLLDSMSTHAHYHWILTTHVFPLCRFWKNTVTTSEVYTKSSNFERELFTINGFTNTFQLYVHLNIY